MYNDILVNNSDKVLAPLLVESNGWWELRPWKRRDMWRNVRISDSFSKTSHQKIVKFIIIIILSSLLLLILTLSLPRTYIYAL